jgi:4-diphosphocytidyl-2-C-methyl-D-erythritol kinase
VSRKPPSLTLPAPAKVNLFLHVTGRRADGYHTLESLFVPIDLADTVTLTLRDDGEIVRGTDIPGVPADDDLAIRAARALRARSNGREGATIAVDKRIPLGAGLGGASSDAASVLLGLNRLWGLGLERAKLSEIGVTLGADVPFFLGPGAALARGIGDVLTPMSVPPRFVALALPGVSVRTADIFAARELTRDATSAKINIFSEGYGRNDLEAVSAARFPEVASALDSLRRVTPSARMSGSGACVFAAFATEREAREALAELPGKIAGRVARTLSVHPLATFA